VKLGLWHILRVFENGALRVIFGPERDEEEGSLGQVRNEEKTEVK
jgi:hypothetical protein